eukprot:PhF_6_TR41664/c0_g1_i1/m.63162/K01480/speB; agmatinase
MAFPYLTSSSFLKVPSSTLENAFTTKLVTTRPFGTLGITWDGSVTNRPGARFGPSAIRQASHMLCDGIHPHFDTTPYDLLVDFGDVEAPNTNLEAMRAVIPKIVLPLLQEKFHMVYLGGDHSITLPILRCYKQHYGVPLAVLHFDAHCDAWTDHFGEPSGHGTWVYEAVREGLVVPQCFVQVGIRSSGVREAREFVTDEGGVIHTARSLRGKESPEQLRYIIEEFKQRIAQHGNPPAYLTFDIDCLDPAFAPGTGTPEPGGLTSGQALSIMEEAAGSVPFVGMDIVEVAPPYDHSQLTSNAASTIAWTYLCGIVSQQ